MSAESLNIFEEAAPNSSIRPNVSRAEASTADASTPSVPAAEPHVSLEIRAAGTPAPAPINPAAAFEAGKLLHGKVLDGKYRIERQIGEGAMGVVLAATHIGLDEPVAIKFMRPEVQRMEGTLGRFAKEAKIAARIRSEHVAKVLDVGEVEPLGPYIVMEYLEGKSLADLLDARLFDRRGPMTAERVVEYLLQACEALAAAHAIGVIHRDVKPDNLFVTRHGGLETLKLLDFGISKAALMERVPGADVATTTTSFVLGTPLYMSPEQLRSLPDVDCRTDVWSMGAVMYELLSGRPPFHAASIPEICAAILDATPAPLPVSCPAALQAVVMCCLEKDRARRFQSMAELAAALVPHAPGDARAYASRASSILRASTLNLEVAREAGVSEAAARSAPRPFRFQSSALVAAATVLALSALGVAIAVSKMRGPDSSAPGMRPTAASIAAPAVVDPAGVTNAVVPPAVLTPAVFTPEMTPPAAVTVLAVTASTPAAPSIEPVARTLTPVSTVAPATPLERHARAPVAPKGKATRAASRSSAAAFADGETREFEAAGDDPERTESIGRVRLVKARPRLRLVERVEPRARPALLSVDRAAVRKPAGTNGTGDVK